MKDQIKEFRKFAGNASVNEEKQAESGSFQNFQHMFGSLLDTAHRSLSTPRSRVTRLWNLVKDFILRKKEFNASAVARIRGTAFHVLKHNKNLQPLVLPLLNQMLKDGVLHHGALSAAPKSFYPSPAFEGVERSDAYTHLHVGFCFIFRLLCECGMKILTATVEACLPRWARECWPGRENSSCYIYGQSNASGQGFAFWDEETGKYINEIWSASEASVLNDFKREANGITIHNAESIPPFLGLALILFLSISSENH